jgi:hypothetical protein
VRKALDGRTGKKCRLRVRHAQHDSEDGDSGVEMGDGTLEGRGKDRDSPIVIHDVDISHDTVGTKLERPAAQPVTPITVGSALRRNPDEPVAIPVMVKRPLKAPKITRKVSYSPFNSKPKNRLTLAHRRPYGHGNPPAPKRKRKKNYPTLIVPTPQTTRIHNWATPTKARAEGRRNRVKKKILRLQKRRPNPLNPSSLLQ